MFSDRWNARYVISPWTICLLFLLGFCGVHKPVSALICYCENEGCPPHHINNTCVAPLKAKCYASVRESPGENGVFEVIHAYGCMPEDENSFMQCKGNKVPHTYRTTVDCCDDQDNCNEYIHPTLKPHTTTLPTPVIPEGAPVKVILVVAVVAFVMLAAVIGFSVFCRFRRQKLKQSDAERNGGVEKQGLMADPFAARLQTANGDEMTSGSGSGHPLLIQTSIARQLEFLRNIGKGRYGEVWMAKFRGENVAVKIFSTLDEASWISERDFYQTTLLHHENILGYRGADIGGTGCTTQMLLLTEYHHASLYDYLRESSESLSFDGMIKMAHSVACGLSHLHAGLHGTGQSKPAIAHRDLKTKNILVKLNKSECVIADFGLAIREDTFRETLGDAEKRQGTRRYMAPELLDGSMATCSFKAYVAADIYSFSLILWELMRATKVDGKCEGHQLPYYQHVGNDPSFEDMKEIVCDQGMRPPVPDYWYTEGKRSIFANVMVECWSPAPTARPTALRAKKSLAKCIDILPMSP